MKEGVPGRRHRA